MTTAVVFEQAFSVFQISRKLLPTTMSLRVQGVAGENIAHEGCWFRLTLSGGRDSMTNIPMKMVHVPTLPSGAVHGMSSTAVSMHRGGDLPTVGSIVGVQQAATVERLSLCLVSLRQRDLGEKTGGEDGSDCDTPCLWVMEKMC